MEKKKGKWAILFFALTLLSASPDTAGYLDARKGNDGFLFLPGAAVLFEVRGYLPNEAGLSFRAYRTFSIDLIRWNRLVLSTLIGEEHVFNGPGSRWDRPRFIGYSQEFINARWEFPSGSISFFLDHLCNNVIDIDPVSAGPYRFRWYGYGFRWESRGMRPGEKARGASPEPGEPFPLLNALNYSLAVSRRIYTERFYYRTLVRGAVRWDILRRHGLVPYIEGSFRGIADGRLRVERGAEAGTRVSLSQVDVTPFLRYEYLYDVDVYNGIATGFWMMGFRMESRLGEEGNQPERSEGTPPAFPEMHFAGNYARHLFNDYLNYHMDLALTIDLVRMGSVSPFLNTALVHDSLLVENGLYPRFLQYGVEAGMAYDGASRGWIAQLFYRQVQRHDGNAYRGEQERYHVCALRLMSRGMKPGFADHPAGTGDGTDFLWLNRWNGLIEAGPIVRKSHFDYAWDLGAKVRWDAFRCLAAVPYLASSVHLLAGERSAAEYSGEAGLRMRFGVTMSLFYRYNRQVNLDRAGGMSERQQMAGVWAEY